MAFTSQSAKLHILIVIRRPTGGIPPYLRYTYSKLDPSRYRLSIVCVHRPEAPLLIKQLAPLPVRYIEVAERNRDLFHRTRELLQKETFDLIHSQGLTAGVLSVLADPLGKVPHVLTLHELMRDNYFRGLHGGVKRQLLALFLTRIDRVVTVSEYARENLLDSLPISRRLKSRIVAILNGVDVQTLDAEAKRSFQDVRKKFGIDACSRCIGFFGRFMPVKGFDVLIEAVRLIVESTNEKNCVKILAVNDGCFIREYRDKIRSMGLSDYFIFPGFQPSISPILSQLDAVIVPSLSEACGLVPMEALAMGCPLISSDCGALREVTQGSPAHIVPVGNPECLANAIRLILHDPSTSKARALAYMPSARKRFDSCIAAEKLNAIFKDVLA